MAALTQRGITVYVNTPTVPLTIDRPGTGTGGVTASGLTCVGGSATQAVPCGARRIMAGGMEITPPQPGGARGSVRMSGGVVIVLVDGTRLAADAGTLNADRQTLELSGNVRVTLPTPQPWRRSAED